MLQVKRKPACGYVMASFGDSIGNLTISVKDLLPFDVSRVICNTFFQSWKMKFKSWLFYSISLYY